MKCDRRQENYEVQLEQLEALLDPAEGEQPSNDEDEDSVPTARSTRARARAIKEKLDESATQMNTSDTTSANSARCAEDHNKGHGLDEEQAARPPVD